MLLSRLLTLCFEVGRADLPDVILHYLKKSHADKGYKTKNQGGCAEAL